MELEFNNRKRKEVENSEIQNCDLRPGTLVSRVQSHFQNCFAPTEHTVSHG